MLRHQAGRRSRPRPRLNTAGIWIILDSWPASPSTFRSLCQGHSSTLGDGHATQGDGEIVGTGIEISMEVQFTVQVIKGKRIRWPRGENAEFIFAVGNARPLDQAVQHATTEMLRWLKEDYGLDATSASLLLGQCVKYDLGNVFDPAYTMVCKVPKSGVRIQNSGFGSQDLEFRHSGAQELQNGGGFRLNWQIRFWCRIRLPAPEL